MGMITHILTQTCGVQHSHVDEFGDIVLDSIESLACRFRYIQAVERQANREGLTSDAMLWLEPGANVEEGDVVYFEGEYFRIQQVTKARKMAGSTVQFLKCLLESYYQVS